MPPSGRVGDVVAARDGRLVPGGAHALLYRRRFFPAAGGAAGADALLRELLPSEVVEMTLWRIRIWYLHD